MKTCFTKLVTVSQSFNDITSWTVYVREFPDAYVIVYEPSILDRLNLITDDSEDKWLNVYWKLVYQLLLHDKNFYFEFSWRWGKSEHCQFLVFHLCWYKYCIGTGAYFTILWVNPLCKFLKRARIRTCRFLTYECFCFMYRLIKMHPFTYYR